MRGEYNFYLYAYHKTALMEVQRKAKNMPEFCNTRLRSTGEPIAIKYGVPGYIPLKGLTGSKTEIDKRIAETRAEFNHLIAVAKDTGCAIVIIAHMNKAKDTSPLYRTNGSIDIAGAARSILAVTHTANKQNPAERYLVQVKSNLAPMGSAILFEVADKGVNFLDELELSAEDAFSASAPRMGRPNAREEAATDFIRSLLAGGRRLASDCEAKLEAAGFKKSTYKKSKKKVGVRSVKDGFLWYWTLPEVEKPIENGQEVTDEGDLPI